MKERKKPNLGEATQVNKYNCINLKMSTHRYNLVFEKYKKSKIQFLKISFIYFNF